jgi:hypothetical protein
MQMRLLQHGLMEAYARKNQRQSGHEDRNWVSAEERKGPRRLACLIAQIVSGRLLMQ